MTSATMDNPLPALSSLDASTLPALPRSLELVREFQAGRKEALHELYQRYEERLRRILRIEMSAFLKRFEDVDDLLSSVYLVAERRLADFEPRDHASILFWLTAIVRNQVKDRVDYHRAERRDRRRETPLEEETIGPGRPRATPAQPSPSDVTVHAEFQGLIDRHVEQLEVEDHRNVILLVDYYGFELESVRQRLGRPTIEAVRELYRRAHIKLRASMDRYLRSEG